MTEVLLSQLLEAAGTRSDAEARLMIEAHDELVRQREQMKGLLRAVELLSADVLQHVDETKKICDQMFAAIVRHLGPPPNT